MLASFGSLVVRDPQAGKRLAAIPPELASEPAGYGALEDFSGVHMLHLDACTKCGSATRRARRSPPAGRYPRATSCSSCASSPTRRCARWASGRARRADQGQQPENGGFARPVVRDDGVRADTVWSCMQCNACVEACPVGIEQAPIINQLRRRLVEEGELPASLQATLQTIHKSGNSFGERARSAAAGPRSSISRSRMPAGSRWTCSGSWATTPRSTRAARRSRRARAAVPRRGLDFGILYDGERNSGNDVRRAGEEVSSRRSPSRTSRRSRSATSTASSRATSLNTLRNEYPELISEELGGSWSVAHHTSLLLELIESGRLPVRGRLDYGVTYHDPCYLGRHTANTTLPEDPRALGCTLVEMPRNRDNSFCCGAGGGRIWIPDEPGVERPSENRIREAVALGELDYFVVSCPKDVTMYEDAIKTSGNAERIELRELTELLEEALGGRERAEAPGSG